MRLRWFRVKYRHRYFSPGVPERAPLREQVSTKNGSPPERTGFPPGGVPHRGSDPHFGRTSFPPGGVPHRTRSPEKCKRTSLNISKGGEGEGEGCLFSGSPPLRLPTSLVLKDSTTAVGSGAKTGTRGAVVVEQTLMHAKAAARGVYSILVLLVYTYI